MFRELKKRLVSAGNPRDTTTGSSSSSQNGAGAGDTKQTIRMTFRKHRDPDYDVAMLKSKVTNLATFDACVEAADTLAVAAPDVSVSANQGEESSSLSRRQHPSGLPDASVLVSVDGNLLLIPSIDDPSSVFQNGVKGKEQVPEAIQSTESLESDEGAPPMFSKLMVSGKDDYESAVYLGSDIEGDRKLNGFSAMGWSLPAASYALGQTEASLQNLLSFADNILLHKRDAAAKTTLTCNSLRNFMPSLGGRPPVPVARTNRVESSGIRSRTMSSSSVDEWEIVDPRANEFVPNTAERTGPMVSPNSSLDRALVILEEYFSKTAEVESEFWQDASTKKGAMLPKLQEAYHRVSDRVQNRDDALEQASQRARMLEERLQRLRKEAERHWNKVYRTEEKVQTRLESLFHERNRQREKARLERLHREKDAGAGEVSQDILDLVAQISEDGGSFEPMELGMNTPEKKRENTVDLSFDNPDQGISSSPPTIPGTIAISRDQVEDELKLPELRASALLANERVEDAAQDLLQALSNLDTTRRAARVVAETTLLNAGNAQIHCIREIVSLERQAIERRLELVEELEKRIRETEVRVREDIDNYIMKDKKERGGTSHLGDDDDGGIASALAVLSSHVDAQSDSDSRNNDDRGGSEDLSVSREDVIAALDHFFLTDQQTASAESPHTWNVDKAVDVLCQVASSANSRSRRSTICYALNSKRSTSPAVPSLKQFDGLCKVFDAVLTSYVKDDTGMANAKMLMMLAQTFYYLDSRATTGKQVDASPSRPKREKRIYVRNRLTGHALWSNDAFWDEAFRTAMAESLTVSGVMSNFERSSQMVHTARDYGQSRGGMMKWYDLNYEERIGAASQVHAVVCAQLGALAHSMIEFGCGLERSCAFVRRTSIRNQLPTSQRRMLLQHLMARHDAERPETPTL
eukprot:scaffold1049_cov168-Amphora_coffeaeformis.AAC.3